MEDKPLYIIYSNIYYSNPNSYKYEIDIVALNDDKKTLLIGEVKRQAKKIDMQKLEQKAQKLLEKHKKYKVSYVGYSLDDM